MPLARRTPPRRDATRLAWLVGGLVLGGCNAIFGLDPVRRIPESLPDAGAEGGAAGASSVGAIGGSSGTGGAVTGAGGAATAGAGGAGTGGASGAGTGGAGTGGAGTGGRGVGGATSCGQGLLRNGFFDEGTTGWTTVPETQVDIRRDDDVEVSTTQMVAPQAGRYLARLGGPSRYLVTWLEQGLVIPADARELTVTGFILIKTDEVPDMAYDVARITVGDEVDTARALIAWSNLTSASGWTHFTGSVNVADLAGMGVTFWIYVRLDENTATYFFFDSVELSVSRCGP